MIPIHVRQYLEQHHVRYQELHHAYEPTAQQTAAAAHVSGKRFAKAVVLKKDGSYLLAVLPAHEWVDLKRFSNYLGGRVQLASEEEFARLFPDCEPGAMPPLGGLYGMPVIAHACLANGNIALNGGTHTDAIEMSWGDFVSLEHPKLIDG